MNRLKILSSRRMVRSLNPFLWLVILVLLCMWSTNYHSRTPKTAYTSNERLFLSDQLTIPERIFITSYVEDNETQTGRPVYELQADPITPNTVENAPHQPLVFEGENSQQPINGQENMLQQPMNIGETVQQQPMNIGESVQHQPMNIEETVQQQQFNNEQAVQQQQFNIEQTVQQQQFNIEQKVQQQQFNIQEYNSQQLGNMGEIVSNQAVPTASQTLIDNGTVEQVDNTSVSLEPTISINCTPSIKRDHYMYLDFQPGRTGNALFQVFCLLSMSSKYCYTPVVKKRNRFFRTLLDPIFEVDHIERNMVLDTSTFYSLTNVLTKKVQDNLVNYRQNWILNDRCVGHEYLSGQENYIRSAVRFKEDIKHEVDEYMETNFDDRPTVAVHVRRTDKMTNEEGYEYNTLEWYRPYIFKAMSYMRSKETDVVFVFVSDDLQWCKDNFNGPDVYFSPCTSVGCDLALVASCDHVVITIGTYGWMGAWLGDHQTVIYNSKYVPKRFYKNDHFFLPSWVPLE